MKVSCLIFVCFFANAFDVLKAQTVNNYRLFFHPTFNGRALHLEDSFYKISSTDSIRFNQCRFYISGIQLFNNKRLVYKEEQSFHLVDAAEDASMRLMLTAPKDISFNQIKFNIGIDSTTNVSGAMGGDLDPTKGMYWTWQSGYINVKLEGQSNLCKTRNNEFEFHLGGYAPYPTCQSIVLDVKQKENILIEVDISKFISSINLAEQHHLMTPGKEAAVLSEKFIKAFSIVQP